MNTLELIILAAHLLWLAGSAVWLWLAYSMARYAEPESAAAIRIVGWSAPVFVYAAAWVLVGVFP